MRWLNPCLSLAKSAFFLAKSNHTKPYILGETVNTATQNKNGFWQDMCHVQNMASGVCSSHHHSEFQTSCIDNTYIYDMYRYIAKSLVDWWFPIPKFQLTQRRKTTLLHLRFDGPKEAALFEVLDENPQQTTPTFCHGESLGLEIRSTQ